MSYLGSKDRDLQLEYLSQLEDYLSNPEFMSGLEEGRIEYAGRNPHYIEEPVEGIPNLTEGELIELDRMLQEDPERAQEFALVKAQEATAEDLDPRGGWESFWDAAEGSVYRTGAGLSANEVVSNVEDLATVYNKEDEDIVDTVLQEGLFDEDVPRDGGSYWGVSGDFRSPWGISVQDVNKYNVLRSNDPGKAQEFRKELVKGVSDFRKNTMSDLASNLNDYWNRIEASEELQPSIEALRAQMADSPAEFWRAAKQAPITVALDTMAQSGSDSLIIAGAGLLGGIVGGVLTGGAGTALSSRAAAGSSSLYLNYNRTFLFELKKRGVDISDPETLMDFYTNNPDVIEEVQSEATRSAGIESLTAAVQIGGLTTFMAPKRLRGTALGESANFVSQWAFQTAVETGGTALQTATSEEGFDWGQTLSAAWAEGVGAPVATAPAVALGRTVREGAEVLSDLVGITDTPSDNLADIMDSLADMQPVQSVTDNAKETASRIIGKEEVTPEDMEAALSEYGRDVERGEVNEFNLESASVLEETARATEERRNKTSALLEEGTKAQIPTGDTSSNTIQFESESDIPTVQMAGRPTSNTNLDLGKAWVEFDISDAESSSTTVSDSIKQMAKTLQDSSVSIEDKLATVEENYQRGRIAGQILSSPKNKRLQAALESKDHKAVSDLLGPDLIAESRANQPWNLQDSIREESSDIIDRLLGIQRRDVRGFFGDLKDISIPEGQERRQGSSGPANTRGKAFLKNSKLYMDKVFRAGGVSGRLPKLASMVMSRAKNWTKVRERDVNRVLNELDHVFPTRLNEDQLKAINNFMKSPSRQNRKSLDSVDTSEGKQWAAALQRQRDLIKQLSTVMKENGMVQGDLIATFDGNMDTYIHTSYSLDVSNDAIANMPSHAKKKLSDIIVQRFNQAIEDPTLLAKRSKRSLKDLVRGFGLTEVLYEGEQGIRVMKDTKTPISKVSKKELVKVLSTVQPLTQTQVQAKVNQIVDRASSAPSKISKLWSRESMDRAGQSRDDSIFRRRTLADDESDLGRALRAAYGEITHPVDKFVDTTAKMIREIETYKVAQTVLDIGTELGLVRSIDDPNNPYTRQLDDPGYLIVDNEGSRRSLTDYTVSEEFYDTLKHFFARDDNLSGMVGIDQLIKLNSIFKLSHTVLNIPSHFRNARSAIWYSLRNGYFLPLSRGGIFDVLKEGGIIDIAMEDLGNKGSPKTRAMVDMLITNGVLRDSARAGDVISLANDLHIMQRNMRDPSRTSMAGDFKNFVDKIKKKSVGALSEAYRYEDEGPKIISFLAERRSWADILYPEDGSGIPMKRIIKQNPADEVTPEMLENAGIPSTEVNIKTANQQLEYLNFTASELSKALNPTYSNVAPVWKQLRKVPLTTPFPSFAFEAYRNDINAYRYLWAIGNIVRTGKVGEQKLTPKARREAIRLFSSKLVGRGTELTIRGAARTVGAANLIASAEEQEGKEGVMDMLPAIINDINQEQNGAFSPFGEGSKNLGYRMSDHFRFFMGDFYKDNLFVVTDFDSEKGTLEAIDLTYEDPHGPLSSTYGLWYRAATGEEDLSWSDVITRTIGNAAGPFIGLEPGTETIANAVFGGEGYGTTAEDDLFKKAFGRFSGVAKEWIPRYLEKIPTYTKQGNIEQAGKYGVGIKTTILDLKSAARERMTDANFKHRAEKNAFLDRVSKLGDMTFDEVKDHYVEFRRREQDVWEEAQGVVDRLYTLGFDMPELSKILMYGNEVPSKEGSILSKREAKALLAGQLIKSPLSGSDLDRTIRDKITDEITDSNKKRMFRERLLKRQGWINLMDREYMSEGTIEGIDITEDW